MIIHRQAANIILPSISNAIWSLPKPKPTVYLTFDDGPEPVVTAKVLEILAEFAVPATFFMLGAQLQKYWDQTDPVNYSAHQIGNHGFSHSPLIMKSKQTIVAEIFKTKALLQEKFARRVHLVRPPYGIWGTAFHRHVVQNNMGLVLWTLMSNDFKLSSNEAFNLIKKNLKNGDILVFHDSKQAGETIVKLLPEVLKFCRDQKIQIKAIGD